MISQTAKYLKYAFRLTSQEMVLRDAFGEWLPDQIIDCHCHCNISDHTEKIDPRLINHPASTFSYFDLQWAEQAKHLLFSGKSVCSLYFSLPLFGIDFVNANQYLLNKASALDRIALLGIPSEVDYTISMLRRKEISALKMYYLTTNPPATSLYDFFKPPILEEAQSLGKPIILHLPVAITSSMEDLLRLIKDFPRLVIILAHLGLPAYDHKDLINCYQILSEKKNLFADTSMVTSSHAIWAALVTLGRGRILYGSDGPLNLIRGIKKILPNVGQRILTSYPYHWSDKTEKEANPILPTEMLHFHWHNLLAIKEAIEKLDDNANEIVAKVFYHNAKAILSF